MKKHSHLFRRLLAMLLALALIASVVPAAVSAEEEGGSDLVLESKSLPVFAANTKADGEIEKINDTFSIVWSAKAKVDSSAKTWDDGYESGQRINFGGKASVEKNAVRITADGPATLKIWWVQGGDDNREMVILDADGEQAAITSGTYTKNSAYISELSLENAGVYYLGGATNNNYIFKVEVTTGASAKPPRADWAGVAAPAITDVTAEGGSITVTVNAQVGYDGADKVSVAMTDAEGNLIDTKSSGKEQDAHQLVFSPAASGDYTFAVTASRNEEEEVHAGAETRTVSFLLPLAKPAFISASNAGGGKVHLEWESVPEAEQYELAAADAGILLTTEALEADVEGLTAGQTYTFTLTALRGEERSESDTIECTVTDEAEVAWAFSAFGTGVTLSTNGYEGSANDGSVQVWSTGGKGKLVPASTDGLAFYYTKIDPETQNFKLTDKAPENAGARFPAYEAPIELPFEDVTENDYFFVPVAWALENGITKGTDATHFSPNNTCTREQIVTFLYAAAGKPGYTTAESPFTDVKEGSYYFAPVLWAVENKVTSGMGGGLFGVGKPCTREQVVTFLWKAKGAPAPQSTDNPFTDVTEGDYFYNAVLWAVENGITKGMSETTFGTGKTCLRGQIVTFLYAAYGPKE